MNNYFSKKKLGNAFSYKNFSHMIPQKDAFGLLIE